jgi:4-diphosphocytidyl-2-C-methyl-D-erythritol kinase
MIGFAHAKINLGLFVTAKRPDGFHDLESLFVPVNWYDILEVQAVDAPGLRLDTTGLSIPGDPQQNLVHRAYNLLRERHGIGGVHAHLHKVIPMGAGLGGGSSDGTCMLRLLNELFELNLSNETGMAYAAELGSDCPFFWNAQPSLVTGRGEHIHPLDAAIITNQPAFITILHPGIHVATGEAFANITPRPVEIDWQKVPALPIARWNSVMCNDFEEGVAKQHRAIHEVLEHLRKQGALYHQMSGTGSACFGIFEDEERAWSAYQTAEKHGWMRHCSRLW